MHEALRMEWGLRQQSVCGRDAEDAADSGGSAEQDDIPGEPPWFTSAVAVDGADDTAHFVVEEEQGSNYCAWYQSRENPSHGEFPELDEEHRPLRATRTKGRAYVQRVLVQICKLSCVRNANENDDADGCGILGKAHANIAVKKRLPLLRRSEENSQQACSNASDNGIEERGKRQT